MIPGLVDATKIGSSGSFRLEFLDDAALNKAINEGLCLGYELFKIDVFRSYLLDATVVNLRTILSKIAHSHRLIKSVHGALLDIVTHVIILALKARIVPTAGEIMFPIVSDAQC